MLCVQSQQHGKDQALTAATGVALSGFMNRCIRAAPVANSNAVGYCLLIIVRAVCVSYKPVPIVLVASILSYYFFSLPQQYFTGEPNENYAAFSWTAESSKCAARYFRMLKVTMQFFLQHLTRHQFPLNPKP